MLHLLIKGIQSCHGYLVLLLCVSPHMTHSDFSLFEAPISPSSPVIFEDLIVAVMCEGFFWHDVQQTAGLMLL